QRNLQTATPWCIGLTSVGADVDIAVAIAAYALYVGAREIRRAILGRLYRDRELELQICIGRRSLLLNSFVLAASTFLKCEIDTRRRSLQNYAQSDFHRRKKFTTEDTEKNGEKVECPFVSF